MGSEQYHLLMVRFLPQNQGKETFILQSMGKQLLSFSISLFLEPYFHSLFIFSLTVIVSSLFISYKTTFSSKKKKVFRST